MDFKNTEQAGSKTVWCTADEAHIGKLPNKYGERMRKETSEPYSS